MNCLQSTKSDKSVRARWKPMTFRLKTLLIAVLFSACVLRADEDSVLWWMFNETTSISDINGSGDTFTIDTLVGRGDAEGKTVNGIRVAAYSGDSLLGYLAIGDGFGDTMEYYEMPTMERIGGNWTESWNAGPTYAVIAPYASTPGVSFMIELGNWDDSLGPGNEWQVLASSDPETIENLNQFLHDFDYDPQTKLEWQGAGYSVPEPSSGMLLLIGGALLALRRRRIPLVTGQSKCDLG